MALPDLITKLEKAEKLLSEFRGGYSGEFLSAQEFHTAFVKNLELLKAGRLETLNEFYFWFLPTCHWDDFTNGDGTDLGNEIFSNLSDHRKRDIYIDLSRLKSIDDFHKTVKLELSFPDFYGENWDAFRDSITGLVEMPETLTLSGYNNFTSSFPIDSKILKEIIEEFNERIPEKKIELR